MYTEHSEGSTVRKIVGREQFARKPGATRRIRYESVYTVLGIQQE